ncbi:shikimate dehydrogenase [Streptomyces acidiscabies]|uniref:Shikimate dehydrogenase n=1 Tax=Streptomyces acidiscabies TaxID=42234 RepID=A0AAP6BJV3_9ACTN|nr:shikimate dehydrogenase [Streptomyces acidiscabies]MBP5936757.1 shikimate dehydrogenase [Streptomyces sp. LBUM 1476]MBZ3915236.1 shikimate dehydrogenase [Streptomyces acidiscabies]MDX2966073.1 shikimate dehydrogenase [Streptomyces acidiscabies]MDX3021298.1 shikimate dehydrogenase [Streptomyces acidiscabies]MDX3793449.1 shikimate dehydrogenase [Streptomyces acidiscabies]
MTRKRLALLGSPVDAALSPVLHRAAYRALGLNWTYQAIDCTPEQLPAFLAGLDDTWAGLSLTMPLKRAAVPLLDEVSDTVKATGTANTITCVDGQLLGENTDFTGVLYALWDSGVTRAESACVLGAGATASTALAVLHTLGCSTATVVARDTSRIHELALAAERIGITAHIRPWDQALRHLDADLVVSALPPGAADPLAPHWPTTGNTLLDVVYRPWPTPLARAAQDRGSTVIGGLPMLVHQAARQVELQTGHSPAPWEAMYAAARRALPDSSSSVYGTDVRPFRSSSL